MKSKFLVEGWKRTPAELCVPAAPEGECAVTVLFESAGP